MEKTATDIYSFCELRENGFTYVDKTVMLLPLVDMSISKQFFLHGRSGLASEAIAKPCCGCISEKCTSEGTDESASFCAFHGNAPTRKQGFAIASSR